MEDIKNMDIQRKRLEKFVDGKNIPVCSFCGNNSWSISSKIFQLLEFDTNGLTLGGPTYPVVPITCNHCGNTLLINALVANLIDPPEDNSPEKEE